MNIFEVKRKPEYYESILKEYSVDDLKQFVLSEFDPRMNEELNLESKAILKGIHGSLIEDIDFMSDDEIVDWCNVAYLARHRKILDPKNPGKLMKSFANPETFLDN